MRILLRLTEVARLIPTRLRYLMRHGLRSSVIVRCQRLNAFWDIRGSLRSRVYTANEKKNRISCLYTEEVRFFKIVASLPVDVRRSITSLLTPSYKPSTNIRHNGPQYNVIHFNPQLFRAKLGAERRAARFIISSREARVFPTKIASAAWFSVCYKSIKFGWCPSWRHTVVDVTALFCF